MKIKAIGAYSAAQSLEPMDIPRRGSGPYDVQIDIAYVLRNSPPEAQLNACYMVM